MKRIIYPSYFYPGEASDLSSLSQDDLFLDIETTGLSKHYNHIYLIGLGKYIPSSNQVHVWQYFAQTEDEEIFTYSGTDHVPCDAVLCRRYLR